MNFNKVLLCLVILSIVLTGSINAQVSPEKITALLEKIKTYDYGKSREDLTEFLNLLREMGDSNDLITQAEGQMIRFLESDATLPSKRFICEILSVYGSPESVEVLNKLLDNPETANMALFALERIPGDETAQSLLDALPKTSGRIKAAVITALGNRRVNKSVATVSSLTSDKNPQISSAAISALANIGGDAASAELAGLIMNKNHPFYNKIIDGYLQCADDFVISGDHEKALRIYNSLFKKEYLQPVRFAALKGKVQNSGEDGYKIVIQLFETGPVDDRLLAIPLVKDIPTTEDIKPVIDSFNTLPSYGQVQLIASITGRKDPAVLALIEKEIKNPVPEVRIAAISALGVNGNAESVLLLINIAASTKGVEQQEARLALNQINAPGVDEKILSAIPKAKDMVKLELIRCTAERPVLPAAPVLIKEIKGNNLNIRIGSIKALKTVATPARLSQLIDLHLKSKNDQEKKEFEKTIVAVALKIPDDQSRAGLLIKRFDTLKKQDIKSSYIKMMGKIGDQASLPIIQTALKNDDDILKTSAIRALSDWPDATPIKDLLAVAESAADQKQRTLALHGYTRLISRDVTSTAEEKTAMYKKSLDLAGSVKDKQLVFSEITHASTIESVRLVAGYLDDQELHQEAEISLLRIISRLDQQYAEEIIPLLKRIEAQTENEDLQGDSRELIAEYEDLDK